MPPRDAPAAAAVKKTPEAAYAMAKRQDRRQKIGPLKERQSPGLSVNGPCQGRRDESSVPDQPAFAKRKYFPKILFIIAEILHDEEKAGADHPRDKKHKKKVRRGARGDSKRLRLPLGRKKRKHHRERDKKTVGINRK